MATFISHRQHVECVEYQRCFEWRDCPGAGFGFPCDESGSILPGMSDAAQDNFNKCIDGTFDVADQGIVAHRWSYTESAVIKCDSCGSHVSLDHFTNECRCGADYNSSGQRLAPRSQWGEETGESVADILRIP